MMQAVFLDRDGTLVKDYADEDWRDIQQLEVFEDTLPALHMIPKQYTLFIVTNQYLIGEGIITFAQFRKTHQPFITLLAEANIPIENTYFCPHARTIPCGCHKPGTGMIEQCLLNYAVDLTQSYFIGDTTADVALAHKIGCTSIAIRDYQGTVQPHYHAKNLLEAVTIIRERDAR